MLQFLLQIHFLCNSQCAGAWGDIGPHVSRHIIRRNAVSIIVDHAQEHPGLRHAMGRGLPEPFARLRIVLSDTQSPVIKQSQSALGVAVFLLRQWPPYALGGGIIPNIVSNQPIAKFIGSRRLNGGEKKGGYQSRVLYSPESACPRSSAARTLRARSPRLNGLVSRSSPSSGSCLAPDAWRRTTSSA